MESRHDDDNIKLAACLNRIRHINADITIYTDGSAKFVGTDFATCSGAVVQLGSDNVWRAVALALPPDRPQGAISGEVLAVELLALVLSRGTPEGLPHEARTFAVGIDCSAVVAGLCRHVNGQHPGRFLHSGVFRKAGLQPVGSCFKIRAHVWEEDARREGWHEAWKGNDMADEYAKRARPALSIDPKPWIEDGRVRTKLAKRLLADLAAQPLWAEMKRNRPAAGRAEAIKRDPDNVGELHAPVFSGGSWVCGQCGASARTFAALVGKQCPGKMEAARRSHGSHALHVAYFGEKVGLLPLVLCSKCGAHGTSTVNKLAQHCPVVNGIVKRNDPCRKQARLVANGLHPSRKDVKLSGMRPLRTAAAATTQAAEEEPSKPPVQEPSGSGAAAAEACQQPPCQPQCPGAAVSPTALEVGIEDDSCQVCSFDVPPEWEEAARNTCDIGDHESEVDPFDFGGDLGESAYF